MADRARWNHISPFLVTLQFQYLYLKTLVTSNLHRPLWQQPVLEQFDVVVIVETPLLHRVQVQVLVHRLLLVGETDPENA